MFDWLRFSWRRFRCEHRVIIGGVCIHCDTELWDMGW